MIGGGAVSVLELLARLPKMFIESAVCWTSLETDRFATSAILAATLAATMLSGVGWTITEVASLEVTESALVWEAGDL